MKPEDLETANYTPPSWLDQSLAVVFKRRFVDRCQDAAALALALRRLRGERQRIGFVPVSFGSYVEGMARALGIPLAPLTAWAGIEELNCPTRQSAQTLARFGKSLGFVLEEMVAHLRIGFAASTGLVPVLAAFRNASVLGLSQLEQCKAMLRDLETDYSLVAWEELQAIEDEVQKVYANDHGSK